MSLKNIYKKILKNKNFKLGNVFVLLENKKKNKKEKRK